MLSRQVAPLLRKFCKVGAYFTIASQRGHALTMLRSFKVILNFSTQYHVAHADSFPSFQHVNNITNFPKALGEGKALLSFDLKLLRGADLRQMDTLPNSDCRKYYNTALEAGRYHLLRRHSLGNQQWQP